MGLEYVIPEDNGRGRVYQEIKIYFSYNWRLDKLKQVLSTYLVELWETRNDQRRLMASYALPTTFSMHLYPLVIPPNAKVEVLVRNSYGKELYTVTEDFTDSYQITLRLMITEKEGKPLLYPITRDVMFDEQWIIYDPNKQRIKELKEFHNGPSESVPIKLTD